MDGMQSNVSYQRIDICIKTVDTILDCSTQIKQEGASFTHKPKEKSDEEAKDEYGGIWSQLNKQWEPVQRQQRDAKADASRYMRWLGYRRTRAIIMKDRLRVLRRTGGGGCALCHFCMREKPGYANK